MKMKRKYESRVKTGSALILVIVLTSLLAIVGVTFIMAARVNRMATSGIADSKDLDSAVDTVIAKISQELTLDVPYKPAGVEYYDYPGDEDVWLACLEPYRDVNGDYFWRRISDIYGGLDADDLWAEIIPDYQVPSDVDEDKPADADGDGVADSKWVKIDGMTSSKGKPIYAAVRIIDDGAMLNVNTSRRFDPCETDPSLIDGSSQIQINLFALAQRSLSNDINDLDAERDIYGSPPYNLDDYIRDVVWQYDEPNGFYTPFDIADELEVRNRFTLNRTDVDSRLENVWDGAFQSGPNSHPYLSTPVTADSNYSAWTKEVFYDDSSGPNDPNYSYRHLGTIYNMDRIINPYGGKMLNINDANKDSIYSVISWVLNDLSFADANGVAAQIAVNMKDYIDNDSNVTPIPVDGNTYYGFERPCVYISELAHRFALDPNAAGPPYFFPSAFNLSYAIELYKPYTADIYPDPNQWRLDIGGYGTNYITWSGSARFHVIYFENPVVPLSVVFDSDPNFPSPSADTITLGTGEGVFEPGDRISLQRRVGSDWITVDSEPVPGGNASGWWSPDDIPHSFQRDITRHKCIRRLWDDNNSRDPNLGRGNSFVDSDSLTIQAHPPNTDFTNIGEIGMVFRKGAYYRDTADRNKCVGYSTNKTEADVRLNLKTPAFRNLFNYLTVFDPTDDGIDNDGDSLIDVDTLNQTPEWKIPGRININTAPWFVLKQLPWMRTDIAREIVDYRDSASVEGFRNIAELMDVDEMAYYADDEIGDLGDFPDLTENDNAPDDFEERDVIFARISNLVTVRSDVFTAYILVRIGTDGPQKRVMAVLDRSDVYPYGTGRVRVRALHPAPDPR